MSYMKDGSLHDYLAKEFKNLKWKDKVRILLDIINGLKKIHEQNIIHHDLHSGNILQAYSSFIADLGLSISVGQSSTSNKNNIYGVLPYIAPEVLNGKPYAFSFDIYSFGIIMAELSSGKPPFYDRKHNLSSALDICN